MKWNTFVQEKSVRRRNAPPTEFPVRRISSMRSIILSAVKGSGQRAMLASTCWLVGWLIGWLGCVCGGGVSARALLQNHIPTPPYIHTYIHTDRQTHSTTHKQPTPPCIHIYRQTARHTYRRHNTQAAHAAIHTHTDNQPDNQPDSQPDNQPDNQPDSQTARQTHSQPDRPAPP